MERHGKPAISIASILILGVLAGLAPAQLDVEIREAQSVRTVTPRISTEIFEPSGYKIAGPAVEDGEPVRGLPRPAVVVIVKPERPASEVLIKVRSLTTVPREIGPGWFVVDDPGEHRLQIDVIGQNPLTWDDAVRVISVGPGGPAPGPDDGGDDAPEPAPDAGPAERVLIVYESAELAKLPADQVAVIRSAELRDLAKSRGLEILALDQDSTFSSEGSRFRELLERDRASLPWLVIDGARGIVFEGPLPATLADAKKLIEDLKVETRSPGPPEAPTLRRVWTVVGTRTECSGGICREVPVYGWKLQEVR